MALTAVALSVALLVARFGWDFLLVSEAEYDFYDLRYEIYAESHPVPRDDRFALVALGEDSRFLGREALTARITEGLRSLDSMEAKSIGLLVCGLANFNSPELAETLISMKTPIVLGSAILGNQRHQTLSSPFSNG